MKQKMKNGYKVCDAQSPGHGEEERNSIFAVKAIAVFCVVCAHTAPVPEQAGAWNVLASDILNYLGTMGVPVFYVLSGYLFAGNQKSFGQFWHRRLLSLFLPWLFCETLLWFYVVLRKGGIGFREWFLFILGYGHTTYYLTVLVVLYLSFWVCRSPGWIYAWMLLSVFSIVSTGWETGIDFVNRLTGTYYLNPLNWIVFFAGGMILRRKTALLSACFKLS